MSDLTKHIKTYRYGITVRRAHVLDDALKIMKRMSFDPTMSIDVSIILCSMHVRSFNTEASSHLLLDRIFG